MKLLISFVASVLLLTGCQTKVWYKPGATLEQLSQDYAAAQLQHVQFSMTAPPVARNDGYAMGERWRQQGQIVPLSMRSKGYILIRKQSVPPGENWLKP